MGFHPGVRSDWTVLKRHSRAFQTRSVWRNCPRNKPRHIQWQFQQTLTKPQPKHVIFTWRKTGRTFCVLSRMAKSYNFSTIDACLENLEQGFNPAPQLYFAKHVVKCLAACPSQHTAWLCRHKTSVCKGNDVRIMGTRDRMPRDWSFATRIQKKKLHQHRPQTATNHVSTTFMHNKEFIPCPIPEKRNERKEGRQAAEPEPGTRRSQKITMEHHPLPFERKGKIRGKQAPEP